jgi:hypothetical protein
VTFTVVARYPRSGQVGIGIATYSVVVGSLCPAIEGGVGVISSQAFVNFELRSLGLNLLRQGHPTAQTLELMKAADPQLEFRQLMVLDAHGRGAGFTGSRTRPWTGLKTGPGYVVARNVLAGEKVVDAMVQAFTSSVAVDPTSGCCAPSKPAARSVARAICRSAPPRSACAAARRRRSSTCASIPIPKPSRNCAPYVRNGRPTAPSTGCATSIQAKRRRRKFLSPG